MSQALPSGYVDTGLSLNVTISGSARVRMAGNSAEPVQTPENDPFGGDATAEPLLAVFNEWSLGGMNHSAPNGSCDPGNSAASWSVWVDGPYSASPERLEFYDADCSPDATMKSTDAPMSASYDYTETFGPYRLGVKLAVIGAAAYPQFAKDYELVYAWFGDYNTTRETSFAGKTAPTRYLHDDTTWTEVQDSDFTPVQSNLPGLNILATSRNASLVDVEFRDLTISGSVVDTSGLSNTVMTGLGGGDIDCSNSGSDAESIFPPYQLSWDIDLPLFGGATSSEATFTGAICGAHAAPYANTATYESNSWTSGGIPSSYEALTLTESDTDLFPANDLAIPLWAAPAREDPGSIDQYYQPVTVALATSLDVHRPDAATPSSFVASGALAVTENATTTVFSVSGSGAYARREFGATGTDLPEWRPWLGVGASGHGDAAFNPDLSHTTKHSSGADIFDWTSYRYLRVNLSAPSAGTLTLTAEGVYLDISDPHTTGSDRPDNFSVTETPYTAVYTFDVASGANQIDLDLCFPVAGGPFYHGRVEAVKFSGFAVGSYTLSGLKLVSLATRSVSTLGGAASVKAGFGAPVQRGDYSALHASHNGANPTLNLGDTSNKPEEVGAHGGALRFVNILTGAESGIIQDSQLSLQTFWGQLDSLEGWTVTWTQATHDAANEDSFGNLLSAGIADWSRPGLLSLTAGGSLSPKCHPVVRRIAIVPGYAFAIYTRHPVYGAVEAIATQGSGPAPAASSVTYGGVTATTDSHGFVSFPGVPTGTTLLGHSGLLTPRDRVRVLASVVPELGGVDLAQTAAPFLFRVYRQGGSVYAERSVSAGATWPYQQTLFTTAERNDGSDPGTAPTLCTDQHDRVWCWAHDSTGAARLFRSQDYGTSWTQVATHAGLRFPRAARQTYRTVLVAHDGDELRFYSSVDDGVTLTALSGLTLTAPRQLASLRVDRRDRLHLVYTDGANLLHRLLQDDGTWSATATLVAGDSLAAYAVGLERGALLHWSGGLQARQTDETYGADGGALTDPTGVDYEDAIGALWSHHEHLYVCGFATGGDLETRVSLNRGASWVAVT